MIYIYTGNGKGKTCACLGQAVRAVGHGQRVGFVQFMKKDGQAGEQKSLRKMLGPDFFAGGGGFFRNEKDRHLHRQGAMECLTWARQRISNLELLILDEILYALERGLVTMPEIQELLELSKKHKSSLILSGRGLPVELAEQADMVTELNEIKHPWQSGQTAIAGLDY